MNRLRTVLVNALLVIAGAVLSATTAAAAEYPSKPIRLIVPFTPGGPSDMLGRVLGQNLAERLVQQVVIDNRGGAGGRTRAVNRVPACGM